MEQSFRIFQKWWGMNFDIAAEEMRRLDGEPTENEKLQMYEPYKQAIHGDIPSIENYRSFISHSINFITNTKLFFVWP